jgi:hypothetical protein
MGLDMYLTKSAYVKNWSFKDESEKFEVEVKQGGQPIEGFDMSTVEGVVFAVMYWRKANAIHQWFVDNVQGGVDECQKSHVSREKLEDLLDACEKVLEDNSLAEELLPTQSGFFFGGTQYDEYYFNDIKETAECLRKELKIESSIPVDYYYQSSW